MWCVLSVFLGVVGVCLGCGDVGWGNVGCVGEIVN